MNRFCEVCGVADMVLGETSTLYCRNCGAQSNQYIEEAFDADDTHIFNTTFVRERGVIRKEQHEKPELPRGNALDETSEDLQGLQDAILSQSQPWVFDGGAPVVKIEDLSQPGSQFGQGSQFTQGYNATGHMSSDELASAIRKSYISGVQKILQMQCESLVKDFSATPLICGIAGPIWLRFVASTRVFEKAWAEEAVMVAENRERIRRGSQLPVSQAAALSNEDAVADKQKRKRAKKQVIEKSAGPRTKGGRHLSYVWLSALKERIPLSMTLAVSYLSCYIAREPILPTDIRNWALNGQLPYLAAFVEISKSAPHRIPHTVVEKQIFPMKPRLMFQPLTMIGARRLELQAGFVAERVGIQLPPVNFHAISALFLRDMGLPVEKLLPSACRLYEWYAPSGLFLSSRESVLPTRVYIMAMLIITIKVLYNLDGRPRPLRKGRLPRNNKKGSNDCVEATRTMMTRAKRKSCAEVGADKEHQINPAKKICGTQMGVNAAGVVHISAPESQILGQGTLPSATSGQDRGSQGSGENMPTFGATSKSRFLSKSARFREANKDLGDSKELLERLESVKTTQPRSFDEELSSYLKYCQNVIFAGDERDPSMEPIVEIFQGIYEKHMAKVRSQPVLNSDEEAAVDSGSDSKPTPRSETTGSPERAGSLERDVPSAGSAWAALGGRLNASKQKQEQKREENVSHTGSYEEFWAQENVSAPAPELDGRGAKRQETSSVIIDMKKAGFSRLPPLTYHLRSDEYVRYTFQDSGKGLVPIHEDYFRVLRASGKLVTVHPKALHRCVQRIEKGLLQVESNVEKFLLGETDLNVIELAKAVKRRKPRRRRDKIAEADNAKERTPHLRDLSYL